LAVLSTVADEVLTIVFSYGLDGNFLVTAHSSPPASSEEGALARALQLASLDAPLAFELPAEEGDVCVALSVEGLGSCERRCDPRTEVVDGLPQNGCPANTDPGDGLVASCLGTVEGADPVPLSELTGFCVNRLEEQANVELGESCAQRCDEADVCFRGDAVCQPALFCADLGAGPECITYCTPFSGNADSGCAEGEVCGAAFIGGVVSQAVGLCSESDFEAHEFDICTGQGWCSDDDTLCVTVDSATGERRCLRLCKDGVNQTCPNGGTCVPQRFDPPWVGYCIPSN